MNHWIITDMHLGHEAMHKLCHRPDDFEQRILKGLGQIEPEDTLFFLGDNCVGRDEYWHERVCIAAECRRVLIRGNHDPKTISWYSRFFDVVVDQVMMKAYGKTIYLSHKPIDPALLPEDCVNIHGHHHNTRHHHEDAVDERHILVYIEHHYQPINLRRIIEKPREQWIPRCFKS